MTGPAHAGAATPGGNVSPVRQGTVPCPSGRVVSYLDAGPADGRPLLWVHGSPGSRLSGLPYHDWAAGHGLRLIGIDRPGWGRTPPPPYPRHDAWAADVRHLLSTLDVTGCVVLAEYAGAPWGFGLAAGAPDLVAALAVVAGVGPYSTRGARRLLDWRGRTGLHPVGLAVRRVINAPLVRLARDRSPEPLPPELPADQRDAAARRREQSRQGAVTVVADQAMGARWSLDLGRVTCPVAAWQGAAATVGPLPLVQALQPGVPQLQVHVVAGGDTAPWERALPDIFGWLRDA